MDEATTEHGLEATILALAEPLATPLGVEVLTVEVKGPRGRQRVRLIADTLALDADAGLDIDTIAALSRDLARALDDVDPIAGRYDLEVTSPGADRPLTRPRDFQRNVGREVRLTRHAEHAESGVDEPTTGTVTDVTESELTLDVGGTAVVVPLADVDHGSVVLPW